MSDSFVMTHFRERRPESPVRPPRGILPEIDHNERAETCALCGYWGIVRRDHHAVLRAALEDRLACHECKVDVDGENVEAVVLGPEDVRGGSDRE